MSGEYEDPYGGADEEDSYNPIYTKMYEDVDYVSTISSAASTVLPPLTHLIEYVRVNVFKSERLINITGTISIMYAVLLLYMSVSMVISSLFLSKNKMSQKILQLAYIYVFMSCLVILRMFVVRDIFSKTVCDIIIILVTYNMAYLTIMSLSSAFTVIIYGTVAVCIYFYVFCIIFGSLYCIDMYDGSTVVNIVTIETVKNPIRLCVSIEFGLLLLICFTGFYIYALDNNISYTNNYYKLYSRLCTRISEIRNKTKYKRTYSTDTLLPYYIDKTINDAT